MSYNGPLPQVVNAGGTGRATLTNHGVLVGAGTSNITQLAAGSANQVLQSGGASADPAYSTATYPATATSTGVILRADGTNWSATTATYPTTTTSQQILYSTANSVIGELTTANSKFPATNSSGTLAMRAFSVVRQVFTSTGTYTPTAGMLYCDIEAVGGGGGGGGAASAGSNSAQGGGGGGGGGYARGIFSSATIGASQSVTIGAAGSAGSNSGGTGGTGGTTSVGSTLISATGGVGGVNLGNAVPSPGGAGGAGSSGDFQTNGSPGCDSVEYAVATSYQGTSGSGGSSFFGGGAKGVNGTAAGLNALSYGGGGSGANSLNAGGANIGGTGAKGVVIITEYIIN